MAAKRKKAKQPRRRGRRDLLTKATEVTILSALEDGCYMHDAAALAGIGERTLYGWMDRGEAEGRGKFWQFSQDVKKARATFKSKMVRVVRLSSHENWQAAAWLLERMFPKDYGRKDAHKLTIGQEAPPLDLSKLSDDELALLDAIMTKGSTPE